MKWLLGAAGAVGALLVLAVPGQASRLQTTNVIGGNAANPTIDYSFTDVHKINIADMNNDGRKDIVVSEQEQSAQDRVGIFYNVDGGGNLVCTGGITAAGAVFAGYSGGGFAFGVLADALGPSSVAIGSNAVAHGSASVALGKDVRADGDFSTALGTAAAASGRGSFVYSDASASRVTQASTDNQFLVRATGGVRLRTAPDLSRGCDISAQGTLSCTGGVALVVLLSPGRVADFEFRIGNFLRPPHPETEHPLNPELQLLQPPWLLMRGRSDDEAIPVPIPGTAPARVFALPGNHHLDRDYPTILKLIRAAYHGATAKDSRSGEARPK